MKNSLLKFITLILILSAIGLAFWLVNQNVPAYGSQIIMLDFSKNQPMLSKLGPEVRTKNQDGLISILESPVYFDLRSMPWFSQAYIYIIYKEAGQELESMAVQTAPEPGWHYYPQPPVVITETDDGFKKAVFIFNLNDFFSQRNVRRFLISTKATEERGELKIKTLKIILSR